MAHDGMIDQKLTEITLQYAQPSGVPRTDPVEDAYNDGVMAEREACASLLDSMASSATEGDDAESWRVAADRIRARTGAEGTND